MAVRLYPHQEECLKLLEGKNRVAIYHDMGLGKTFTGSEKMHQLGNRVNLVVCQKSKVQDWVDHLTCHYGMNYLVFDLTRKGALQDFLHSALHDQWTGIVGVINYDIVFRRAELSHLTGFTLMLDESSLIGNEHTKRARAVLRMKPANVILLSGTPTSGKYEKLWSQCRLLGWGISKKVFWGSYICTEWVNYGGFLRQNVTGYKNVDHLKKRLAEHGAVFLKTEDVMDLPGQVEQMVYLDQPRGYKKFCRHDYLVLPDGTELIGSTQLTKILYQRQLCGQYSREKLEAFRDLITSTEDNIVVFYNFNMELSALREVAESEGRICGVVNGKHKDGTDGINILFVQYQAGAYGLNLQGFSNRIIYYTLPLGKGSCDLWEQSKKRIHRIGQGRTCFYYYLLVRDSIETKNLACLREGKEYTDYLFE